VLLASDVELAALLLSILLAFVAPFFAFGLVVGYRVGNSIKHPRTAGVVGGLAGLISFCGSLGTTTAVLIGHDGASPGEAAIVTALFVVVLCAMPVFVWLSYVIYHRRARLSAGSYADWT
jgi:hypothetical protein